MVVILPHVLAISEEVLGNPITQIAVTSGPVDGTLVAFQRDRLRGFLFTPQDNSGDVLIVPKTTHRLPNNRPRILHATVSDAAAPTIDLSAGTWLRHPLRTAVRDIPAFEIEMDRVRDSWVGAFSYIQEDPARGITGLRLPQIGALHAVHAHWSVKEGVGTIVMPTGTGKTETMLSVLVTARCSRVLVIVPTDALRTQLTEKFRTLGVLKANASALLVPSARFPIVGTLVHIPQSVQEVDEVLRRCQVIVTTSSIAGRCDPAVQKRMAELCPYLFIDEAHHTEAPTWSALREVFRERRILQFTATPFREDGRLLEGDIIYKYPLRKAQQEEYFKPIRFTPVVEFNPGRSDQSIAERAIQQLRADADRGHILMARVDSVDRAKHVFELYRRHAEFNPVQLHSGIGARAREAAREQILRGESRIVVCVDMLGEGFDLPELKIAAFHDIRKTLAVTLQLAGRFTRARPDLGDAVFIANVADINVQEELRKLYTRDPDWNELLPQLSESLIDEQVSLRDFLAGFTEFPEDIPLKTVRPATSTVVYKTLCDDWQPEKFTEGIPGIEACEQVHHGVNEEKHTLVVVTARRVPLDWTDVETVFSWQWELYVVMWSPDQALLFINSSTNSGEFRGLAHAIAGADAALVNGQQVFRVLAGVNRLRLQNVGLTEQLGRNIRYTGRMGADVEAGLPELQKKRARKAVLYGTGFEGGEKVTVGASRKGRIWSFQKQNVEGLAAWCRTTGAKVLDESIDPDEVLKGTLDAKRLGTRPPSMPVAIDWPEEMYKAPEANWAVVFGDDEIPLSAVSIELHEPSEEGPLTFAVASDNHRAVLELEITEDDDGPAYQIRPRDGSAGLRRGRSDVQSLEEFFFDDPPVIWFVDGASLEGNEYVQLKTKRPPYDPTRIIEWDWTGINLRTESQGPGRDRTSIQARVIAELQKRPDYAVIIDDDGKGEVADVVAIRLVGDQASPSTIEVEFYHCKYSLSATPGARIKDMYEVCGQAQKSISWMTSTERQTDLFTHLLRRDAHRQDLGQPSRFERGDRSTLLAIREMSRIRPLKLSVHVVQPGVSAAIASRAQLELMSVTENYLMETYQVPFGVIASP
jgi:superfamily II DNA or RNA helicase